MNNAAISPYICMHALQIQNVKRNVVKKVSIKELNNEIIQPLETQQELSQHNEVENINEININGTNINEILPEPLTNDSNIGSNIQ
jgi:hypothetical protein